MSNARHRDTFRPKLIALSVAACFSLSATQVSANPTGGTVSSGGATFATSGNTLTVTNTANAIINWQSFSIGVNEITRFLQSSGSSAVLNRVVGANGVIPQSVIDGILSSNGRVFLLNSSGIVIGKDARIDVAGFVASSLNLSDADSRDGKMRFTKTPGAGKVSNAGVIDTTSGGPGGRVFLVGPEVENSGVIRTPQGQIVLAAGKSVELVAENSPFVTVNITADSERALNVGQLLADSGRIGMFGALVRQSGTIEANSAVLGANGEIRLVATKDLTLDAGSRTTANGASGGNITLQAQGGTNLVYGTVEAKGSSGQGGTIQALGVRVGVLGNGVIDASGDASGGTVLVGGDAHGANPNVQNAQQTLIGPDGVIRADAATTGDGGRVIVWSDAETRVFGSISAKGGAQSGNGGFIETSSKGDLDVNSARIDARAPNGQGGTWLLDPLDVVIEPNSYGVGDPVSSASSFGVNPGATAHITEQTIENAFYGVGNTSIQATHDVLFKTNLNLAYSTTTPVQTFEVRAVNNIDMAYAGTGAHTITTFGQNVTLSAGDNGNVQIPAGLTGTGSIIGGGNIVTNGGNIVLSGYGVNVGALNTSPINPSPYSTAVIVGAGNVSVTSSGNDIVTGSITTHAVSNGIVSPGGAVALTTTYGNILVYGTIDTHGADGVDARSANSGTPGGAVSLVRTIQTTPGTILVTGDILTYGGSGIAGTNLPTTAPAGAGGSVLIYGGIINSTVPAYGNILVYGRINARGGNGAPGALANVGSYGGTGGSVLIYGDAGHSIVVGSPTGSIDASGGNGGNGSAAYGGYAGATGGNGGTGGTILVLGGTVTAYGSVASHGGAGGNGGSGSSNAYAYGTVLDVGSGGSGGNGGLILLSANTVSTGAIDISGGAGGLGGSNNTQTLYGQLSGSTFIGVLAVGSGGNGGNGGQLSVTGNGATTGAINTSGGAGGAGGAGNSAVTIVYGTTAELTVAAAASAGAGGIGGYAGLVSLSTMGAVNATGAITAAGGVGGAGGANSKAQASAYAQNAGSVAIATTRAGVGGNGGAGATVTIGGTDITIGSITTSSGAGGAGGGASSAGTYAYSLTSTFSASAYAGLGGNGGVQSGSLSIAGGTIKTLDITTAGAFGGAAGTGGSAIASGYGTTAITDARFDTAGLGEFGGSVSLGAGGDITTGSINASGFGPGLVPNGTGTVSISSNTGVITTGKIDTRSLSPLFNGGAVSITTVYGRIAVQGDIDARGADGSGSPVDPGGGYAAVAVSGGSNGGNVTLARTGTGDPTGGASIQVDGSILASGGNGFSPQNAAGGAGGAGGAVNIQSIDGTTDALTGSVNVAGAIDVHGGYGGAGGIGFAGGAGGTSNTIGTSISISAGNITVGSINISGGAGGAGGADPGNGPGAGGNGGDAGSVNFNAYGTVSVGNIIAFGGDGGNGGATTLALAGGLGGDGGEGGFISMSTSISSGTRVSTGSINIAGGRGGNGGNGAGGSGGAGGHGGNSNEILIDPDTASVGAITATGGAGGAGGYGGTQGGAGGSGGFGAFIGINGIAYGGTIAVGNIDVSGGAGGSGGGTGAVGVYGGAGGSGGSAGSVDLFGGAIDASSGGITAIGGAGGAGGSGSATYGGAGGSGSSGGFVDLLTQANNPGPYGIIFATSAAGPTINIDGGTAGAGGTGGGLPGSPGSSGSQLIVGTIQVVSIDLGLPTNTVIQGTNQLIKTNNAPSSDDLEKKEKENKQKKEAAVCK